MQDKQYGLSDEINQWEKGKAKDRNKRLREVAFRKRLFLVAGC